MARRKMKDIVLTPNREGETVNPKKESRHKFWLLMKNKVTAGQQANHWLQAFASKTDIKNYLDSNPDFEIAEKRLIRGYEKPLIASQQIRF